MLPAASHPACSTMSLELGILNSRIILPKTTFTSSLNPLTKTMVQLVGQTVNITPKLTTIHEIFHILEFHLIEVANNIKAWAKIVSATIANIEEVMKIKGRIQENKLSTFGQ